jgi:hypothetical protein
LWLAVELILMDRRTLLRTLGGLGAVGVAGCLGGTEPAFTAGFEDGLGDWTGDAAIGPEVPIEEFDWEVGVSEAEAATGSRSLRVWNEGDYDDGVSWGVHPVPVEAGESYRATVTAELWSESESFNTLRDAMMRLGPERPETEEEFPNPGVNTTALGETPYGGLREPLWLTDGWRTYSFEWTTPELPTDTLHVAVGTAVIWEGDATHYVDDLAVEFEPR